MDVEREVLSFLRVQGVEPGLIDVVVTGDNGDEKGDRIYREIMRSLFPGKANSTFKEISGEYPTAASVGLWKAANAVREGARRVLLYNHYLGIYHSVYLLSDAAE